MQRKVVHMGRLAISNSVQQVTGKLGLKGYYGGLSVKVPDMWANISKLRKVLCNDVL